MRLLVVEDERDLADAIARGLRSEGYAVDVSYDGADAFAKASVNTYDLLCLDVNLPGMSGRSIAGQVRAQHDGDGTSPRIIMLTALGDLEDRVAKLQRAVYYLIWKRTGFGEQCVHCGHAYPAHAERCKAAEVEGLVR